jgi:hypothetical protein
MSPRVQQKLAGASLTIHTSNDAVTHKEVPFGGHNASKSFQGVHLPQLHQNSGGKWDFHLNKTMNNFSTVHAIFAQTSSIGVAWHTKLKNFNGITRVSL